MTREEIKDWFIQLQDSICSALEEADGSGKFKPDEWSRPGGGGGVSRVLNQGAIIEKGGVNFSAVGGKTPDAVLKALKLPDNDHSDMNVRYFEMTSGQWWFGGGIDLTPHYINEDDARYFHGELKKLCDRHDPTFYNTFKTWADDYFFIKHRNETRGVGGIFFDNLNEKNSFTKQQIFKFVQDVGLTFAPMYTALMKKNYALPYDDSNKQWQYLRRGRYVEFNLVWDRGTKFGLETDGRTESILMSLPPQANWLYNYQATPNSAEEKTVSFLRKGIEWV
jgi:coproporphyrinogen III oxidase